MSDEAVKQLAGAIVLVALWPSIATIAWAVVWYLVRSKEVSNDYIFRSRGKP